MEANGNRKIALGLSFKKKYPLQWCFVNQDNVKSNFGAETLREFILSSEVTKHIDKGTTYRTFVLNATNHLVAEAKKSKTRVITEEEVIGALNILNAIINRSHKNTLTGTDMSMLKPLYGFLMKHLIGMKGTPKAAFLSLKMTDEVVNYLNSHAKYYA